MKPETLYSTLIIVLLIVFESRGQTAPNLIYLNADDLGVQDVGFMGGKLYRTPNLDSLVAEGMTFSDGYAPSAIVHLVGPPFFTTFSASVHESRILNSFGTLHRTERSGRQNPIFIF